MSSVRTMLIAAMAAFLLNACAGAGTGGRLLQTGHAEQKLSSGVKYYEEGDYKSSAEALQNALDAGLKNKSDQVSAHKYLAFIHCVSKREKQCRDAFRNALQIDPGFELKTEEAGHPVWGPVFRSVKALSTN
ncbi:hypothetical protein GALLN_00095 [Gallionellaceae bacterium]|nr:hypothetical protein GALLN_00095 [Gallionellaceae bacterium]